MELYNKIYKYISRALFVVHCAYFVFVAVCMFLPFIEGGTSIFGYYWGGWYIITPFISLAILAWGVWCTLKCPESPLLALGTGVFTVGSYVMVMALPTMGAMLKTLFIPEDPVTVSWVVEIWTKILKVLTVVYFVFLAYSILTFILSLVKPKPQN
ncbi:MAG: hypothetical protein J6Q76_07130 [Clostridia bacterium]|nr:hypothetical protein [Clostridia bacterium]